MTVRNAATMGAHGSTWEAGGYYGCGNVGNLIGTLQGQVAVVAGNAYTVFEDLDRVLAKFPDAVIFAVNDVGMYLPNIHHWVSLHADHLGVWKPVRWSQSRVLEYTKYHSVDARPYVDALWDRLTPVFPLSGYFAMQIAYIMGAEHIVLCGCPGLPVRRFFESRARESFGYGGLPSDGGVREMIENEMTRVPQFRDRVSSLSGWTKEYFGSWGF